MRSILIACVLALAGCGDNTNPHVDTGGIDGAVGIDGNVGRPDARVAAPDAGPDAAAIDAGPTLCTGAAYDSCADTANSTDCLNGATCHLFQSAGITVCAPACNNQTPCPNAADGTPGTCTGQLCKPDMANACTLP